MLCQVCNKREANVHVTKIINGVKTELHLCEECASKNSDMNINMPVNIGVPLSFQNILEGFVEMLGGGISDYVDDQISCPVCHMTFEDFRRTGKLGCSNCYSAFGSNINPLVKRLHGNIHHTGKVPKRSGGVLKTKRDIEKLKEELKAAVKNEEYEKAAKYRDEIKLLESKLNDGNDKE